MAMKKSGAKKTPKVAGRKAAKAGKKSNIPKKKSDSPSLKPRQKKKSKNSQIAILSFSSENGAKSAAYLLKRQLESVGDTKVGSSSRGCNVALEISANTPSNLKAAVHTSQRLASIMQRLDAQ